ncbi:MAG: CoA transferase [Mycolicibacterium insubricum]|nr:CoA transferase [Mycobacterium sp.]
MTTQPLRGLRIIEFASFVAGPSAGMTLAQLGAEVIRIDPTGGAPDYHRWPVSARTGASLYWSALNRGKRSVQIDVRSPQGRELVLALATAPGPDAGIVVDNQVGRPWLGYGELAKRRGDVIRMHIGGRADGGPAVDYTVNTEVGITALTGPADTDTPVNHVLPAWDLIAGMTATTGLLAALRHRDRTGEGSDLALALADVALAGVANMGWLTEAREQGDRPRHGNYMYGTFGVDFVAGDGARVMVVALTGRQWQALCAATGITDAAVSVATVLGADFTDEAQRYEHREVLAALMRPWFAARTGAEVADGLDAAGVLWSRYRRVSDVVADLAAGRSSAVVVEVDQPGIGQVISARNPLRARGDYGPTAVAEGLGDSTDRVLGEVLGLDAAELARLHDAGVIG